MKSKYKLTSFARFIFFMLVFIPASYLGVGLYKGEITFNQAKFKISHVLTPIGDDAPKDASYNCSEMVKLKEKEITLLKEKIEILESSIK